MSSSSAPIEIGHRKKTIQQTYGDKVVGRVRELFDVDSVEYGLAISGSLKLVPLLEQHIRTFSPDAVLAVDDGSKHREGIVNAAQRMIAIRDLRNDAYTEASPAAPPELVLVATLHPPHENARPERDDVALSGRAFHI